MREIKFRAFQDNEMLISPISSNYGLNRFFGMLYEDTKLMQFTGLKDKNGDGVEVWEGDVFEAVFKDCIDGYSILGRETEVILVKAVVVFIFGGFHLELMHPKQNELVYINLFGFLKNEQKVVLGNIHENPELLNK